MRDLRGSVAVVTGANSGIGRETALELAGLGATVVLGCRNAEAAKETAGYIRRHHPDAQVVSDIPLDLASLDSVRGFASELRRRGGRLRLLINNAGVNYIDPPWHTPEGVGGMCQVNYLGPYALARLLEPALVAAAPSRVVNVSSITHRYGRVPRGGAGAWLRAWRGGSYYPATKLANVLHAYETHRRLAPHGVQSCAVDPGGVRSNIWRNSWAFGKRWSPLRWLVDGFYAPPADAARGVVAAATAPWGPAPAAHPRTARSSAELQRRTDLRYFARGLFGAAPICAYGGYEPGLLGHAKFLAWGLCVAVPLTSLDWPLRRLSKGRWHSKTCAVPSVPASYDEGLARELWEASAEVVGAPVEVQLK